MPLRSVCVEPDGAGFVPGAVSADPVDGRGAAAPSRTDGDVPRYSRVTGAVAPGAAPGLTPPGTDVAGRWADDGICGAGITARCD